MNCCFPRAVKNRSVHSDRLCRSALSEWEGFKDSGEAREAALLRLVILFSSSRWRPTRGGHFSSISTRVSTVTFWQRGEEVPVEGKKGVCCWSRARQQIGACRRGSAQRKQLCARLSVARNTLKPCTWVTTQASCREKFIQKLFLSVYFYRL